MKTMKKKSLKKYQGDTEGSQVKGSKGAKTSKVIAGITSAVTGAAALAKNIADARKRKKAQQEQIKMDNLQKVNQENRNETLREMESMGQQKKGGSVMKKKMAKASKGVIVKMNGNQPIQKTPGSKGVKSGVNTKASASNRATGRSGGTSTAPKTAVPKAKYGMVMRRK